MKKAILILTLFLIYNYSIAQNNTCGALYYTQTMDIGFQIIEKTDFLMKFNSKESYAEEINIKSSKGLNTQNDESNVTSNIRVPKRTNLEPKFFYNAIDTFYYMTILVNESIIVKEDKNPWKWQLHEETKKIGDFVCQKATIDFHGRSYIAWFTNKIPVPFGPWKFQGLSGLILEAYDTKKTFHVALNKIEINNNDTICKIDINKKQLEKALTTLEFQQKIINIKKSISAKMRSRIPKGVTIKNSSECEDCPKGLESFDKKDKN